MEKAKAGTEMLVEPLTKRERAILAHLLAERSNAEIAELETLAGETVKWYVKQIYAKLGVNKREEVAGRARELGLLQKQATTDGPAPRPKNNLPAQLTSFIGREKEIAELRLLLKKKETRLLTLTGSGGTGKTRLSQQVAAGLLEAFPDGVWLVELAPLADPGLVPQTAIAVLGLMEHPTKTPLQQLSEHLREKQVLLILDNCEHLAAACADLAERLLQAAPRLAILASSREILGVGGEQAYRVAPLRMPDARQLPALEELAHFEAVRLFIERAQGVDPTFTLTDANAAAVARITQRLDGIPLALELAAARLRVLSVEQIADRLADAFRLLTGGSRTALPRHQTLTALIDWSYDLLTEQERALLRSLSVFAGSWTLEGAEAVGSQVGDVLDLLGQLADKSLILAGRAAGGEMRYRMLETVRQYAHARLVEAKEAQAVRGLHLDYYLGLSERLEPKLRSREQVAVLNQLGRELDNLRLALEWALQTDVEAELRLASALLWFWHTRCIWSEGIAWLEPGLEAEVNSRAGQPPTGPRALVRAKAAWAVGYLQVPFFPDTPRSTLARPRLEEARRLYLANGLACSRELAWTLFGLGQCKVDEGNAVQGRNLLEEALGMFRETCDLSGTGVSLVFLGEIELDPAFSKKLYLEALAIEEAHGDTDFIATALLHLGFNGYFDRDYESACSAFTTGKEYYLRVGNLFSAGLCDFGSSDLLLFNGDLEGAAARIEEALKIYKELGREGMIARCLLKKCGLAIAQGQYDRADALNEESGRISQRGDMETLSWVHCNRSKLARLRGDAAAAWQHAEQGLATCPDEGWVKIPILLEFAYLALQKGDLKQAGEFCRVCFPALQGRGAVVLDSLVDGLALLAAREGKLERAARLFGTRLWRGFANTLSPIERAEREADFAALRATLGEERFDQLREEGWALSFTQVLALAQER